MSNETSLKLKSYNNVLSKKIMKDVCNIFAGGTPSTENKSYWNGHINWIPSGLVQDCVIDEKNVKTKITNKGLLNSSAKMIKPDSALLAITGATCGKSGYLPFSACANQSVMAFEPYTYSAKYIYYLFQKNKNKILKFQAGGAQAGLNKESCENLTFLFHEETEQKQIAEFLSNVDSLLEDKKKELEKTKQFKQTMLSKMFPQGDSKIPHIRFDGYKDEWKEDYLSNQVKYYNGLTYSPKNIVKSNGTLVLRSSNVQNSEISLKDNIYVKNDVVNVNNVSLGDIIIVVRNGSRNLIGKHAIIKTEMKNTVIGAFMTGIKTKNPSFINALLSAPLFKKQIEENMGATINQITGSTFDKMIFSFPSKDEQVKIGEFFDNIDNLLINQERELTSLEHLKTTLLNKMFA